MGFICEYIQLLSGWQPGVFWCQPSQVPRQNHPVSGSASSSRWSGPDLHRKQWNSQWLLFWVKVQVHLQKLRYFMKRFILFCSHRQQGINILRERWKTHCPKEHLITSSKLLYLKDRTLKIFDNGSKWFPIIKVKLRH